MCAVSDSLRLARATGLLSSSSRCRSRPPATSSTTRKCQALASAPFSTKALGSFRFLTESHESHVTLCSCQSSEAKRLPSRRMMSHLPRLLPVGSTRLQLTRTVPSCRDSVSCSAPAFEGAWIAAKLALKRGWPILSVTNALLKAPSSRPSRGTEILHLLFLGTMSSWQSQASDASGVEVWLLMHRASAWSCFDSACFSRSTPKHLTMSMRKVTTTTTSATGVARAPKKASCMPFGSATVARSMPSCIRETPATTSRERSASRPAVAALDADSSSWQGVSSSVTGEHAMAAGISSNSMG
mmetsp:Transcript_52102/g.93372  ORF Transcript_52102/g.93372 Transcript_52102/m.93372 type:complete len:299 (-) Transcript_52102:1057-1953(-)